MKEKDNQTIKKVTVNALTASRLAATFAIAPIYMNFGGLVASACVAGFFLTDFIDGFLARKWHVQTFLGSILDAGSDKTLAFVSLASLITKTPYFAIPLGLELGIFISNYCLYKSGKNIQANKIGKLKAWFLASGITLGFLTTTPNILIKNLSDSTISNLVTTSYLLPSIACGATLASYCYSFFAKPKLSEEQEKGIQKLIKIKENKDYLNQQKKTIQEILHDLVDTDYYLEHKDEPISRLLLKEPPKNE